MSLDGRGVVHRAAGDKCVILRVGKTRVAKLKLPLMKDTKKKKCPTTGRHRGHQTPSEYLDSERRTARNTSKKQFLSLLSWPTTFSHVDTPHFPISKNTVGLTSIVQVKVAL